MICSRLHQPRPHSRHRSTVLKLGLISAATATLIVGLAACSPNQTPDQIRQKTADTTAAIKRDTKAVAEGVKDGLSNKRAVDLNRASKPELASLPGIDDRKAAHIIAERPYANTRQLVTRHVITEAEYSEIQDRVVVNR